MLAVGILIFMHNIVKSWRKGEIADGDPWDGRTLEWSIPSPPPEYNFEEIPTVYDRDDWWARKRREVRRAVPVAGGSGEDEEHHDIHLPQPSYWPLVVAIGIVHRRIRPGISGRLLRDFYCRRTHRYDSGVCVVLRACERP